MKREKRSGWSETSAEESDETGTASRNWKVFQAWGVKTKSESETLT